MNKINKNILLEKYDIFIDNYFLDKYCEVINNSIKNEMETFEKHHIIPKAYYKANNIPIDNTENNIVSLTVFDHLLAHYYLYYCISDITLKNKLAFAFNAMKNGQQGHLLTLSEEDFIKELPNYCSLRNVNYWKGRKRSEANIIKQKNRRHSEETKRKIGLANQRKTPSAETRNKMSESAKNRTDNRGRGTKRSPEYCEKMKKIHLGEKQSEETKRKRSNSIHQLKWFNDGVNNIRAITCPKGFKEGRIIKFSEDSKKKFSQLGKKWYNDGYKNIMSFEYPEGFKPGRIKK